MYDIHIIIRVTMCDIHTSSSSYIHIPLFFLLSTNSMKKYINNNYLKYLHLSSQLQVLIEYLLTCSMYISSSVIITFLYFLFIIFTKNI
jgi:hypothetical protein